MFICVWCAVCWRLLLALCDGRRKGKEGTCVSMTTHLLAALYKARRGGRERRANRYWQGTLWNKGRPMLPADCNSTCMRSFRTEPTCRQRPRLRNISIPITFLYCPAHSTLDQQAGKGGRLPCQRTTRSPHNPPRGTSYTPTDTEDMLQHPSDWTKRRATQTKQSEAEHIGSVRVEEVALLLESSSVSYICSVQ